MFKVFAALFTLTIAPSSWLMLPSQYGDDGNSDATHHGWGYFQVAPVGWIRSFVLRVSLRNLRAGVLQYLYLGGREPVLGIEERLPGRQPVDSDRATVKQMQFSFHFLGQHIEFTSSYPQWL